MTTADQVRPNSGGVNSQPRQNDVLLQASRRGDEAMLRRDYSDKWIDAIEQWTNWLDAAGRSEGCIRQRRWQLRLFADTYKQRSPWKLKTIDLIAWYTSREWGPGSRHSACGALRGFYGWAVKAGLTKHNPALDLPAIKVAPGLPRPAEEDTLALALATASDRTRLMVLLAAYAGLRDAEIAGLRWDDVTNDALIVTGKGKRTRHIWQHKLLIGELTAERERRKNGELGSGYRFTNVQGADVYVFPGRKGHMSAGSVSRLLSKQLGRGVTGHQLRHRFATRVLNKTNDLAAVQDLLGHANSNTTRVYTLVANEKLRSAVDAI